MPSFGEKLKLEREKRKITLDQVSSSTKIGTRMLQALEEDKFSQLPGGIFNKGFVRAYARAVGLDEDQTVADYLEASGDAPPVKPETREPAPESHEPPRSVVHDSEPTGRLEIRAEAASRQLPWGIFAVVLLVVALALSLWNRRRQEQRPSAPPTHAAAQEPSPAPTQPPIPSSSSSARAETASPASAAPLSGGGLAPPSSTSPSPHAAQIQPIVSSAAAGEFTLQIAAREESWISIAADGQGPASELLPAGSQRTVHARKDVVVRAGNSGALDFQLNGKPLAVGGDYGEVKTVTIGPAGLLPNAPVPSPSP